MIRVQLIAILRSKWTLTNLDYQRPTWLDHAHQALDAAVAAAYGWTDYRPDLPDDELLRRLLALNLARSQAILAWRCRGWNRQGWKP